MFRVARNEAFNSKFLFTPGPPPVLKEGVRALRSAFGRGDDQFDVTRSEVLTWLETVTGHQKVVDLQGSGSLALEIMIRNFVYGSVLLVKSGYYSERLLGICREIQLEAEGAITSIATVEHNAISEISSKFDWVIAVYVDTSVALKQDLTLLSRLAKRCSAKLALDAVASIGLEEDHGLADVAAFSSCKGLFGITGASFISYDDQPTNQVSSFYMNFASHTKRQMTGPYAQIQYLHGIMSNHETHRNSVEINKNACMSKFSQFIFNDPQNQPLLCTRLSRHVSALDPNVILYQSRNTESKTILNHLGEIHLKSRSRGKILDKVEVVGE